MQKKALSAGLWAAVIGAVFFSFETRAQQVPQTLHGHVPPAIARFHLQPLRDLPETNRLNLAISLPLRNQAALDSLLQQIYDPASTNYHQYLTPQQFTERFGPSEQDYDTVVQFAKANGLTVTATSFNRVIVDVSGSVDTVEKVFHVAMHTYQHPTENRTFFAPDSDPVVNLNVPISHISGLDNFTIPRPALKIKGSSLNARPAAEATSPAQGTGPSGAYMGKDFRAAYAPGVTLDGTGQKVGLLELEGYYPTDIATYEADAQLPNVTLTNVSVDGFSGPVTDDTNGIVEVSLDIEMEISMATNASEIVVFEEANGGNIVDILNAIAANSFVKQVSSSWLLGDSSSYETIYQEMAAQGQSFFQASGDNGAYYSGISEWADDTNITLVGGTTLTTASPGGTWSSETAWNWLITAPQNGEGATGGGTNFNGIHIPSWQQGVSMTANQGSTTLRNVPDVALTADNIFVECTNTQFFVGGTSAAAPLWAGFTALMNQQAVGAGRPPVGFLNPAIYAIGKSPSYTNDFHDITTGNNTNLVVGNKWFAVPGYDLCTGWGTPNGQNLINTLAPPDPLFITPVAGFTALGPLGGPFSPNSQVYTLSNSSPSSLTWSLINTSSWLNVSSAGGTVAAGGTTTVTISLNSVANSFDVGTNATLTVSNGVSGVTQNFQFGLQVIDPLVVAPATGLAASGAAGGPFNPVSQNFSLTNLGSSSLNWQAAGPPWLNLSPSSGTIAGTKSATVSATLNANASSLVAGIYAGQVSFTDEISGTVEQGLFTLSVGQNIVQNGGFETGDFTDWTLSENPIYSFVDDGTQTGISPHSGNFFAAFGHPTSLGSLSQTLPTVAGQTYLLSAWLNSPNVNDLPQAVSAGITINTPNQLTVSWNGTTLFNQSNIQPINGWTNLLFVVNATGSSTALKFGERVDPWYLGLDDVNVWPMPSPNIRGVSQVSNNTLALTWNSLPGLVYQVQYSTNLLSTNWFNLSTNTATGTTLTVTTPIAPNGYLFYRVLRLP